MKSAKRLLIVALTTVLAAVLVVLAPTPAAAGRFVAQVSCVFGVDDLCEGTVFTVPAGALAVIESVSGTCVTKSGTATREFQLRFISPGGSPVQLSLPPSPAVESVGTFTGNVPIAVSSAAAGLKSYAAGGESGSTIEFLGFASANQTPASFPNCVFTVSGDLWVD